MNLEDLTDVGPATPTPNWCLAGAQPEMMRLTDRFGGGVVWNWERMVSDDVWVCCIDRIVDGRVMRSRARIQFESHDEGLDHVEARAFAAALVAAADLITCAALDDRAAR